MAVIRYKVLVHEIDGVEQSYPVERSLDADSIYFTHPEYVSDNVQDAIVEGVQTALDTPRFTIILIHNGLLGNGDYIGYSNLIPGDNTPIVVPIGCELTEFTFSNENSSADFELSFRKNSTNIVNEFASPVFNNTRTASYTFASSEEFAAGDTIYIRYGDNGNNASDTSIVLFFRALPPT